jgi:hypothetical protein
MTWPADDLHHHDAAAIREKPRITTGAYNFSSGA